MRRVCALCSQRFGSHRLEASFRHARDPLYVCSVECAEKWEDRQRSLLLALDGTVANPVISWTLCEA